MKYWQRNTNYMERETQPYALGNPWVEITKDEYDRALYERSIIAKASKGILADDIVLLHLSFIELLTNYINWLPYSALGEKQRFKIIIETLIKYNLELVNKDYDPNFTISSRDKGVLLTALQKVKEEYPDHYALMVKPFKLEANVEPDEVWTAYEAQMEIIHSNTQTGTTLSQEMANSHTGA